MRLFAIYTTVLLTGLSTAFAQNDSDRFYQAIRNNDSSTLTNLIKTSDVNTKDGRGSTPLMYAAAFGSLEEMQALIAAGADVNAKNAFDSTALLVCASDLAKVQLLLDKGADVNAQSKPGRTALMIAAGHNGASDVVKLLLDRGANVNARDASGDSALLEATSAGDIAIVKLLLEKNADVNAAQVGMGSGTGTTGLTPLMSAAGEGNAELVKMLLAKRASVNAVSSARGQEVKNGPLALGLLTPLHLAVATGQGPEAAALLLAAGAKVDAQDVRGMTPLMLAVSSDRADPRTVKLLLDNRADPRIQSKTGESALDWARKFNQPDVLKILGLRQASVAVPRQPAAAAKLPSPRQAAEKSVALLQKSAGSFFTEGGCVSCHSQNLSGAAASVARANGIHIDATAEAEQLKAVKLQWASADQILIQGITVPGEMDTVMYSLFQLIAAGAPADRAIDAMIHNLAWLQRKDGNWHFSGIQRPPMEDGDFSRTAICVRALAAYAPAARKAEFEQRIARAAAWLRDNMPKTTEDRNMQLLGLKWANGDRRFIAEHLKQLIALQRPDGGWSQTPDLASDAYATGTSLYTLHELGVAPSDPVYQRGVQFLLRTQLPDGSWHVASRAPKFQPYFQSGFPHDHDQWISATATAWSSMALSYAATEKPMTASLH
ncbi:MAG TPA: ankyrin repeat domain-containing protein [Bryobacteraceae bacterium]|nr:ankyrin repeat domain-containing protein [Bryobacteraceae bacterium]